MLGRKHKSLLFFSLEVDDTSRKRKTTSIRRNFFDFLLLRDIDETSKKKNSYLNHNISKSIHLNF